MSNHHGGLIVFIFPKDNARTYVCQKKLFCPLLQVCYLKLGSWAYNGYQVNVFKRSNTIDLSNYVDNGEWKLIGVKVGLK